MTIPPHPVRTWSTAVTAVVATVALLAACGGDDDASSSTTPTTASTPATTTTSSAPTSTAPTTTTVPPASTYTIVAGDSLSAIADRADVTLDELIAANGWTDGADHLILPGDVIQLPEGSSIATDTGSSVPASGEDAGGYGPATVDLGLTDDRTAPVVEPLADGVYYAQDVTSNGGTVTFVLGQWFACDGDGVPDQPTVDCGGGVGTLDDPSTEVGLSPDAVITVATGDLDDPTQADVTVAEYARLVGGASPAADAPAGYAFVPFPTLVEVKSGSVVAVEQFYTS